MSYASEINQANLSSKVLQFRSLLSSLSEAAASLDSPTVSAQRLAIIAKDLGKIYDALADTRTELKALSGNATPSAAEDVQLIAVRNAIRDLQVEVAKTFQSTGLVDAFEIGSFDGSNWATLDTNFEMKPIPLSAPMRATAVATVAAVEVFI